MRELDRNALDRYITGNYGEDQYGPEVPERFWCECAGESADCPKCAGTGYDQAALREHEAEQRELENQMYESFIACPIDEEL